MFDILIPPIFEHSIEVVTYKSSHPKAAGKSIMIRNPKVIFYYARRKLKKVIEKFHALA